MVAGIFGLNYLFFVFAEMPQWLKDQIDLFPAPSLRPDQAINLDLHAYLMLEIQSVLKVRDRPRWRQPSYLESVSYG